MIRWRAGRVGELRANRGAVLALLDWFMSRWHSGRRRKPADVGRSALVGKTPASLGTFLARRTLACGAVGKGSRVRGVYQLDRLVTKGEAA
jgi:hypothetical protein